MSKFVKYIKCNLMMSAFLGIASVTAMEGPAEGKRADEHMKRAYTILDVMTERRKAHNIGPGVVFNDQFYRAVEHLFEQYKDTSDEELLQIAETELNLALELNHQYAAWVMRNVYGISLINEEAKTKLIEALSKSLKKKQESNVKKCVAQETSLLMDLKGLSYKTVEGLHFLEEFNLERAIQSYGYLSTVLDNPECNGAFDALMRLQQHPSTWLHLANAYFSRNMHDQGMGWMRKILTQGHADETIFGLLRCKVEDESLPLYIRSLAAYLVHQHSSDPSFNDNLKLYKLLKKSKAEGYDFSANIICLGGILERMAEESLQTDPDDLYHFALTQEEDLKEIVDTSFLTDQYRRAADAGSGLALEKLTNSLQLLLNMEAEDAILFLVRHNQGASLLKLYENQETTHPLYLMVLRQFTHTQLSENVSDASLGEGDAEFELQVFKMFKEIDGSYPPAIDYTIKALKRKKNRNPEDHVNINREIKKLERYKTSVIELMSDEELYSLAQEYNLLHRVADIFSSKDQFHYSLYRQQPYRENYVLMLERSAAKGFLPSVCELVELYTNGYYTKLPSLQLEREVPSLQSSEKAAFYQGIKDVLTDVSLSPEEQVKLPKNDFEPKN